MPSRRVTDISKTVESPEQIRMYIKNYKRKISF